MNKEMAVNPHANHRQRMFDRALTSGFDNFADHELLEMLLFYSIPRVNTNPTAHELLTRFCTIKDVMCASTNELCTVDGVGERSAILIRLIAEMMKRYERAAFELPMVYRSIGQIVRYLHPCFVGVNVERLYALLFNNRMNLLGCVLISEGSTTATDLSITKISKVVFQKNASAVLLAHNHPNGVTLPSQADLEITDALQEHLAMFNVELLEHLVFVDYNYRPILKKERGKYRVSPISQKIDVEFYNTFYEDEEEEGEIPRFFTEN